MLRHSCHFRAPRASRIFRQHSARIFFAIAGCTLAWLALPNMQAGADDYRSTTGGYVHLDDQGTARYLGPAADALAQERMAAELPAARTGLPAPPPGGLISLAQYLAPGTTVPPIPTYGTPPALPPPGAPVAAPMPVPAPVLGCPPLVAPCVPPPTRHYVNLDALGWWVQGDSLPALVTTSPIGTEQSIAGVLGEPTTTVLFGDQTVNTNARPGGRVQGGVWIDPFQSIAIEGHYYGLATATTNYFASSTFTDGSLTDPILARPFFDANPLVQANSSLIVAFPDFQIPILLPPVLVDIDGSVQVQETSRVQSAGGGGRYALGPYTNPTRLFIVGGYRYFSLNEALTIVSTSTTDQFDPPFDVPAGYIETADYFSTKNTFNGGEIGMGAEMIRNRWTLGAETRLALGNMAQTLTIDGRTSAIWDVYTASYVGGLLAQPTNIGTFSQNKFALIPQVDVKVGYHVLPALRLTVGYNFTYVSSVLRPGDQVDLSVNTTQIAGLPLVGDPVPAVSMSTSGMWLQGLSAGLDFRF